MHLYIKPVERVSVNIEAVVEVAVVLKTFYFLPIETRQDEMSLKPLLGEVNKEPCDVFRKGQCHILSLTQVRNLYMFL
jgi:hypothetical protein